MDWSSERYVRLYVRDTTTWMLLGFEGQAIFALLLRKLDRTGILEIDGAEPWEAAMLHLRCSEETARLGMQRLLDRKVFEHVSGKLILPNYVEAQEASMTPQMRQKEHRLRRRDMVRAGLDPSQRETAIYFVQSEHGGEIKIGRADDVAKRLVGLQTSRPDKLVLLAAATGTVQQERALHERFAAQRAKGEWFWPSTELMTLIADVAVRGPDAFTVTTRDVSQVVTANEPFAVTPSRAVPSQAEPSQEIPPKPPSGAGSSSSLESAPANTQTELKVVADPEELAQRPAPVESGAWSEVQMGLAAGFGRGSMPVLGGKQISLTTQHCKTLAKLHGRSLFEVARDVSKASSPGKGFWAANTGTVDPYRDTAPATGTRVRASPGTTGADFDNDPIKTFEHARAIARGEAR